MTTQLRQTKEAIEDLFNNPTHPRSELLIYADLLEDLQLPGAQFIRESYQYDENSDPDSTSCSYLQGVIPILEKYEPLKPILNTIPPHLLPGISFSFSKEILGSPFNPQILQRFLNKALEEELKELIEAIYRIRQPQTIYKKIKNYTFQEEKELKLIRDIRVRFNNYFKPKIFKEQKRAVFSYPSLYRVTKLHLLEEDYDPN